VIHFSRLNKLLLLILLSIMADAAFASQQASTVSDTALAETNNRTALERDDLTTAKGLIMLDYEVIPVPGNKTLDLFGLHYLHPLNSWLYLGLGLHAPLVYGNYGGFMTFDTTIHAQHRIFGNSFIDAGASFGGGGGGSSVTQSKTLSGKGGFIKSYVGLGYDFRNFSAGVNFTHFRFVNSPINHSQLNLFFQKPVSYTIGSYAYSGQKTESDLTLPETAENILALELNNIFQIKPTGTKKKTINTLSLQYSHFVTQNHYLFFGAEAGYKGLPLYNQFTVGMGYRFAVSPHVNFYSQIGVGSGGYSPQQIDTGPGLLVYPKLSVEYLFNNNLGLSLSSGYLFAPKGTSKNVTLGAALNYHLSSEGKNLRESGSAKGFKFSGYRFTLYQQTEFNVRVGNSKHANLNLVSLQMDKVLNENWYFPVLISVAYNDSLGYPGYGEILTGLGIQNKYSATNNFQNFFQILIGADGYGIVLKPSIGSNYALSDNLALYGQLGATMSLDKIKLSSGNRRFSSYSAGLGLTYRFSLPGTFLK